MTTGVVLGRRTEEDIGAQPACLATTLDTNDAALHAARSLLSGRSLVRLAGIGSSRHAAGVGAAALELLAGLPTSVVAAPGAAVPSPVLRDDHALVVLSQSGETPALLDLVGAARAVGAPVIAVTNSSGSALSRLADVALDCAAGAEQVVAATKSVTAQVLLLRGLAAPVGHPDLTALVQAVTELVEGQLERFVVGAPPEHVVASGLGAEWVAAEVALKFAETAGRLLSAEPVVEHLHGPAAVPAAILALVDPADPNTASLAGAVVRVGPDPSYEVPTRHVVDPALAAIVALVAGQCAALAWSRRLGADADAPRGLAKVTHSR